MAGDVTVYFASINTAAVSELCIRTMHRFAGYPFQLVVGDGGSTDGSLEMFRRFERAGKLRLEIAPEGRKHTDWLDRWFEQCSTQYAVFVDSDVEFRRPGWLRAMVDAAGREDAALVATRIQARHGQPYRHPITGAERILAPRPEPWLMLLDVTKTRARVHAGFAYRDEEPSGGGPKIAFDTGAAFFRALVDAGLTYVEMPSQFAKSYRHFGGMSWARADDRQLAAVQRLRQAIKNVGIRLALERARVATKRELDA
jgi:glycosyltransferase involved in cell wall biosynthesis